MKPITDDVVFTILEGLEKREWNKRTVARGATTSLSDKLLGKMSGRRIISLRRTPQRARRTVSGMFCYVARDTLS
ncbi:MAG: hypothetical protein AAF718_00415 [Pseudomonadota bacterium]